MKVIRQLPGEESTLVGNNYVPAPWHGLKNDPIFVFAHGSPDSAAVTLANGKVVDVGGDTMARILSNDATFKAAAGAKPKSTIAMISCNFANEGGDAGQKFADTMRDLGNKRPIFAATETVKVTRGEDLDGLFTSPGETIATLAVDNMGEFKRIKPTQKGAS